MADRLSNILSSVSGAGGARARSAVFGAIIAHAGESGVEEAIARFGAGLSEADKATLRALAPEELETLSQLQGKTLRPASCRGQH